jgi:deoxyribodipyrimidine photolyase-like uncharacterized protein
MKQCIGQTLQNGYSNHIQGLMATGLFGVTAQISPQAICDWYLAVYVHAVEWLELTNTAGMALMVKNLQRITPELPAEVHGRASELLANLDSL